MVSGHLLRRVLGEINVSVYMNSQKKIFILSYTQLMRNSDEELCLQSRLQNLLDFAPGLPAPRAAVSLFRIHVFTCVPVVHSSTASVQAWSSHSWALQD